MMFLFPRWDMLIPWRVVFWTSLNQLSIRNQRCERPIFTRSHLRNFAHISFWGFHGNTTSYLSSQSALFEPCASKASMEVVVGNCEQKLGIFRGFRKERWMLSILLFRLPFHTPDNPKIWGKCLASCGVLIFVIFGLLKIFATFGQKPKKTLRKPKKTKKTKKPKKTKNQRFEGNVWPHIVS